MESKDSVMTRKSFSRIPHPENRSPKLYSKALGTALQQPACGLQILPFQDFSAKGNFGTLLAKMHHNARIACALAANHGLMEIK